MTKRHHQIMQVINKDELFPPLWAGLRLFIFFFFTGQFVLQQPSLLLDLVDLKLTTNSRCQEQGQEERDIYLQKLEKKDTFEKYSKSSVSPLTVQNKINVGLEIINSLF